MRAKRALVRSVHLVQRVCYWYSRGSPPAQPCGPDKNALLLFSSELVVTLFLDYMGHCQTKIAKIEDVQGVDKSRQPKIHLVSIILGFLDGFVFEL